MSRMSPKSVDDFRAAAEREAEALRDPYYVTERLEGLFRQLAENDREAMKRAIIRWLDSSDPGRLYDAMWLISEFKISEARPALLSLLDKSRRNQHHEAQWDQTWIERTLRELDAADDG